MLISHIHAATSAGFDMVLPSGAGGAILRKLLTAPGARQLDLETLNLLRIEAGIPVWGAELTESVIPLEANLSSAINQSKGCYLGQEVIARIISRGHTNRSLTGLCLSAMVEPGAVFVGASGPRRNQDPAKTTSVADSPEAGPIALGYVRNEYSSLGTVLQSEDGNITATVTALPFVA